MEFQCDYYNELESGVELDDEETLELVKQENSTEHNSKIR